MKKLRLLIICCIVLPLLISGCSVNKTGDSTSIPLLLNTNAEGGTETYSGVWDLSQCSVKMNEKLYKAATPAAAHPTLWDGKSSFVMEDFPVSVEKKNLTFDNNLESDGFMKYFCSPSLTITLKKQDEAKTTKILHYQDKKGTKLTSEVPNIKPPQEYEIADVVSAQEIFYAAYEDETMYTFFSLLNQNTATFTIYCLTYNPTDSKNGTWTKFELESKCSATIWYQNVVFSDKKLYLSGIDDLLVLDVSNNKTIKLSSITEKAKNIIPNSSQESANGAAGGSTARAILPDGAWDDVVIAVIPIYTQDNIVHTVYFAFQSDKILGAIDITNDAINVYDSALKLKNTCLSGSHLASISLPKVR